MRILASLVLVLSLVSCGKKSTPQTTPTGDVAPDDKPQNSGDMAPGGADGTEGGEPEKTGADPCEGGESK